MSERTIDVVVFDIGGVLLDWSPTYLYAELIPERQLAWGSDWPWFEGVAKYPQLLQAIVDHATFSDEDRRRYLGENAVRHWSLSV